MISRVLVLTSSTGSGHDMRARAFTKWIRQLHGDSIKVHVEQIIENGSMLGRFGVWVYNTIHKRLPFLHNIYFFIVELFVFTHAQRVSFGGKYYRNLLKDFKPDLVLSVHDSTNRGYFEDAKRILGDSVRCVTYCGEFSGGYGFSRNWVNTNADLLIARTNHCREHVLYLGMPMEKTSVFHKFLPPESFEQFISDSEKEEYLNQLGMKKGKFTVFLATGGFGANHHLMYLNALLPLAEHVQVIIICGRNEVVRERVSNWCKNHPQLTAYIEGYSSRVADFLQVSDAVITRGGANTTTEALHFDCPLLYDAIGGMMPQERCTVNYFLDNGAARIIKRPEALTHVVSEWCRFDKEYKDIRSRLDALHYDEDPRDLIQMILGS
ncbi:MAG: glycosyltransferase [Puniceicoccaceae bacterium]